jgi:hypothetical protein
MNGKLSCKCGYSFKWNGFSCAFPEGMKNVHMTKKGFSFKNTCGRIEITDSKSIADKFNNLFPNVGARCPRKFAPPKIWPPRAKFPRKFGPPGGHIS